MCAVKRKEKKELGIKIVGGKTVIQYANGLLTENGFEADADYDSDKDKGICYIKDCNTKYPEEIFCEAIRNGLKAVKKSLIESDSTKSNSIESNQNNNNLNLRISLNKFLQFCNNSEFLIDGLIWGIVLNTLPVISQLLAKTKCFKPIVFFKGGADEIKTVVARSLLTTGIYRNEQFSPFKVITPISIKNLKKELTNIHSSLILLDDIYEMFNDTKNKIESSIKSICKDFYDYTNDCSLIGIINKDANLEFLDRLNLLDKIILIDFSNVNQEEYLRFANSNKNNFTLKILTSYHSFLLRACLKTKNCINHFRKNEN